MGDAKPARAPNGQLLPGHTSNPGGRPKKLHEIEAAVLSTHGPKVVKALEELFRLGMCQDMQTLYNRNGDEYQTYLVDARTKVAALSSFIAHVKGAPRSTSAKDEAEESLPDEDVPAMLGKLFERPEIRKAALTVLEGGKK